MYIKNKRYILLILILLKFSLINNSSLIASPKIPRTHDGFLFRTLYGLGAGTANVVYQKDSFLGDINEPASYNITREGLHALEFGGAINDIVQLYVGYEFNSSNLSLKSKSYNNVIDNSYNKLKSFSAKYWESTITFGASFYIPSVMIYFKPSIVLIRNTLILQKDNFGLSGISTFDAGLLSGYGLTIGKEWWVANDWAIGFALYYQNNSLNLSKNLYNQDYTKKFDSTYYGLAFSTTYN